MIDTRLRSKHAWLKLLRDTDDGPWTDVVVLARAERKPHYQLLGLLTRQQAVEVHQLLGEALEEELP